MSSLRGALVLAYSTLVEALRNRLFIVAILFGVVLVGMSVAAASVSIAERSRLIVDVGLAATSVLGSLIAVILSINTFASELKSHTAYPILARPIPRWGFILGKYLGVVSAMILIVSVMTVVTALTVKLYGGQVPTALWGNLWLAWIEMALICAIAFAFSSLAVPALAASYSAGLIVAGNLSNDIQRFAERLVADGKPLGQFVRAAYYAMPDLQALSARLQAANDLPLPATYLLDGTLYGLAYAFGALCIAMWTFSARRMI